MDLAIQSGARGSRSASSRDEAIRQGRLILLAEDNPVNLEVILEQLRLLGHAADAAVNGSAALAMSRAMRYGLLLTDCNMPEIDGFALTARIRAAEREAGTARRLPIVALTANASGGEERRCREAGMDDYLSKPVAMAILKAKLERWLPAAVPASMPAQAAPGNPEMQPIATVDVCNLDGLTEVLGDDGQALSGLLAEFCRLAAADLALLTQTAERCDARATELSAHRLKGSARIVGARRLAECCEAIEIGATVENWPAIRSACDRLPRLLSEVEDFIAARDSGRSRSGAAD